MRSGEDQAPDAAEVRSPAGFPVVGLGASAGGLRALQEFFSRLPADSEMAFVVVSHHHADQQSLLPELLGRFSKLSVEEASKGTKIEANRVYVAPPGRNLALAGGVLRLVAPSPSHGAPLPIDSFLRSLAEDARERAVAIILSGTGSDGTLGVQSVKAESGLVLVQDEESAEFSGMPASAIATGLADFVVSPEEMPERLLAWARGPYTATAVGSEAGIESREEFTRILALLRMRTGHDFSGYKTSTLVRRIQRRQYVHQLDRLADYVRFLEQSEDEAQSLFQEFLIGVTSFFRDAGSFDAMEEPLAELLAAKPDHSSVRAWIPGCSTGEEAYSFAILLRECLDRLDKPLEVQIFATDIDGRAIETARQGLYPEGIAGDLSKERLARFFSQEPGGGYRVVEEIRETLLFASQDILGDPPFTHLDFVSCRNLLIYLGAEVQRRVLALLHYALDPDGLLLIGSSEATTGLEELFVPLDRHWKLYRRLDAPRGAIGLTDLPPHRPGGRRFRAAVPPRGSSPEDAARLLARTYAPPSVLVNARGDIVQVHGRTGSFLEPAEGRASLNLLEMAREGLRSPLSRLLREVERAPDRPAEHTVRVRAEGGVSRVCVVARRVAPPDRLAGLILVSFGAPSAGSDPGPDPQRDETPGSAGEHQPDGPASISLELAQTRGDLQTTIEELQSANEELASSHEEVQSTNEELQSANEELETSREEMQSLNEELQTVNAELRAKVSEVSAASDDMANLLDSISVATLFLDKKLRIKRFTSDLAEIMPIQTSDVGRPFGDLTLHIDHTRLAEDAAEVLRTLESKEAEIHASDGGKTYLMRLRAYRTSHNVIDGVVVTFVDVTRLKALEASELARTHSQAIVETVRQPLLVLDGELCVLSANRAFCDLFRTSHDASVGRKVFDLEGAGWDVLALRELLLEIVPKNSGVEDYELACDIPTTGRRTVRIDARRMAVGKDQPGLILLAIRLDAPEGG